MEPHNIPADTSPPSTTPFRESDSVHHEAGTPRTSQSVWSQGNDASAHLKTQNEYRIKVKQRQQILDRINIERILPHLSSISVHELEAKLSVLERQYESFHHLQSELELMNDEEFNQPHRGAFDESFCAAQAIIVQRINVLNPARRETIFNSTAIASPSHRVNLPKLQLTKFNGHHRNWMDFYNMFLALVHNNSQLANIEKFQYLRSCLVDSAASLIESFEVTDENYIKALDLLQSRYGNKRLIVQAHIQHIFEVQGETRPNASSMRAFIDVVNTNLRAVQSLASNQQVSDGILLHLVSSKLNTDTKAKWEEEVTHLFDQRSTAMSFQLPTWEDLAKFLERRCQIADILEAGQPKTLVPRTQLTTHRHNKHDEKWAMVSTKQAKCEFCNAVPHHNAFKCDTFRAMDPLARYNCVKGLNLCLNCLGSGHKSNDCPSVHRCKHCNVKHHTLLHRNDSAITNISPRAGLLSSSALKVSLDQSEVILGTAIIHVFNSRGVSIRARALLDSGSQLHFITEKLAQHLRVTRKGVDIDVSGIGQRRTKAQHLCCITIKSLTEEYSATIDALIIPSITSCQPSRRIDQSTISIPDTISIADPTFNIPGQIDILIGAGLFFEILSKGQIRLNGPVIQNTKFGWVVAGAIPAHITSAADPSPPYKAFTSVTSESILDKLLERFWAIEDIPASSSSTLSSDELECESYFSSTTHRCPVTNKFIVRLPFRDEPHHLGSSEETAGKRMFSLESKLNQNSNLRRDYNEFMEEYINMKHMIPFNLEYSPRNRLNYIPHHGVTKLDSSTTKLRVVFDASCKTSNGCCLNDMLRVGPQLQDTIFTILTRFRRHKYVIMADIAKMYRQIWVDDRDTQWQCIFWRPTSQQPLTTYQLQTVTYGTSCAPYLAVKCLQQLAIDEAKTYPIGSNVTLSDFYVDNLISGAASIGEVIEIKNQTINLLNCAGFPLRKFASNASEIVADILPEDKEETIRFHDTELVKTLGLKWSPVEDCFLFHLVANNSVKTTKRSILSKLASFFDPIGLLNPLIVTCKILMQQLWKLKSPWDDEVPPTIKVHWELFNKQLPLLQTFKIPRYANIDINTKLHAFADASTKAYGACVYAAWSDAYGVHSSLLCAKSRVAPTTEITLPRLELCAALMAAELMSAVNNILNLPSANVYCWSDSTIALAWIAGEPSRWNVFVANRVAKIQQLTKTFSWNHVPTDQNPADIVSRGACASELLRNTLWWHGPEFIQQSCDYWPSAVHVPQNELPEQRLQRTALIAIPTSDFISKHKYVNSYMKLLRIFAYATKKHKISDQSAVVSKPIKQFSEVVWDHLQMAPVDETSNRGKPVLDKWSEIEARLSRIIVDNIMANLEGQLPGFDSVDEARGYRVIKYEDQYSLHLLTNAIG
ncbi:uncharacterized protein LOC129250098 [Anastrepha obliqua]|uniref:uncharacterized protein LOC129250098 n=1 Tax=Anastrepha obliqua TaxID=95512 RepID=UPI002409D11E|nr:uncharacterized protein LOC129250098 [Anastrepha obliqua]